MLAAIGRALARVWHRRRRTGLHGFQDQREAHRFRTSERPTGYVGRALGSRHLTRETAFVGTSRSMFPPRSMSQRSAPWSFGWWSG
jgi:hypothetical protein